MILDYRIEGTILELAFNAPLTFEEYEQLEDRLRWLLSIEDEHAKCKVTCSGCGDQLATPCERCGGDRHVEQDVFHTCKYCEPDGHIHAECTGQSYAELAEYWREAQLAEYWRKREAEA